MEIAVTLCYAMLGGLLAHLGHSWSTGGFWAVMALAVLIGVLNRVLGGR